MDIRSPRAVGDLLLTAVPDLRDRLLEHRIRRAWREVVGADAARRAQPRAFTDGCLTVAVDNSPWLHELTLRGEELTRRLSERFNVVRSLRFVSGSIETEPAAGARVETPASLDARAQREIDEAAGVIPDPAVAAAARRLLTKAWRGLPVIMVVTGLTGCAAAGGPTLAGDEQVPRRAAAADPRADAYYTYSVAQMHIQAGRFKEAVPLLRSAIQRDPNSAPRRGAGGFGPGHGPSWAARRPNRGGGTSRPPASPPPSISIQTTMVHRARSAPSTRRRSIRATRRSKCTDAPSRRTQTIRCSPRSWRTS